MTDTDNPELRAHEDNGEDFDAGDLAPDGIVPDPSPEEIAALEQAQLDQLAAADWPT